MLLFRYTIKKFVFTQTPTISSNKWQRGTFYAENSWFELNIFSYLEWLDSQSNQPSHFTYLLKIYEISTNTYGSSLPYTTIYCSVFFTNERLFLIQSNLGGARGVMVIVVGNGHGDTNSNPGRDWLHFI